MERLLIDARLVDVVKGHRCRRRRFWRFHLDAVDGLEAAGPRQGEEAGAAVGVDEVLRAGVVRELDGVADELLEDGRVGLEELAGEELELHRADLLGDDLVGDGLLDLNFRFCTSDINPSLLY